MLMAWIKKILVVLLLVINLSVIERSWIYSMDIPDRGVAALDRWEAQMILVKKALPINHGIIGYISEQDVPGVEYGYGDTEAEFLLTQYALAPLILKKGPIAEWNVVVLDNINLATWQKTNTGPYEITTIKGKVRILHRLNIP